MTRRTRKTRKKRITRKTSRRMSMLHSPSRRSPLPRMTLQLRKIVRRMGKREIRKRLPVRGRRKASTWMRKRCLMLLSTASSRWLSL
jgi:hypothetical protein